MDRLIRQFLRHNVIHFPFVAKFTIIKPDEVFIWLLNDRQGEDQFRVLVSIMMFNEFGNLMCDVPAKQAINGNITDAVHQYGTEQYERNSFAQSRLTRFGNPVKDE